MREFNANTSRNKVWIGLGVGTIVIFVAGSARSLAAPAGGSARAVNVGAEAPSGKVIPDPRAVALLRKEAAAVQAVRSLTATYQVLYHFPHPGGPDREMNSVITVSLMRPNYAYLALSHAIKSPQTGQWGPEKRSITMLSDGTSLLTLDPDDSYEKKPAKAAGQNVSMGLVDPLMAFFQPSASVSAQVVQQRRKSQLRGLRYLGSEAWEGRNYQVVEWRYVDSYLTTSDAKAAPGGVVITTDRMDFGVDGLSHRTVEKNNMGWEIDYTLRHVQINPQLTKADFALNLPTDAHKRLPPPALLADGTAAPDFTVQDKDGKPVKLSDYHGKAVVLDFWATWCGPCRQSLPHTNAVAAQFKGKNVVVLAVNVWDTPAAFQSWLPQHAQYGALQFAIDPAPTGKDVASALYHVSGIPTQYVIGPDGKIITSFVGYGGPTDDLAKALQSTMKQ